MKGLNTVLVPVDFSRASFRTVKAAAQCAEGKDPLVILLHVLDRGHIEYMSSHGLVRRQTAIKRLREAAQKQLAKLANGWEWDARVETVIAQGLPFFEILKKAEDFQVDCIVMGKLGARGEWDKYLFGSTAEKVVRSARCPVLVVP
jgi:nucleotide-binding universal stress UspA family protein